MKRLALYVRVSTEEQRKHGISVDSQIDALTKYAEEHGDVIVNLYNDAGYSSRKKYTTRPALLRLLDDCKKGLIDQIIFTKLDRWFRSVSDYYLVQSVLDDNKVTWRAIWEDYETETSAGIFKVNIMLSIAQAEADRASERIRAVKAYQKESGAFVGGKLTTGYIFKDKKPVIDEEKREIIRGFFDFFLKHGNINQSMLYLRKNGLPLCRQTVVRMLKSENYVGIISGFKVEPYITQEEHAQILSMMNSKPRNTANRVYIFSGILRCPICGGRLGGSPHMTRYKRKRTGETITKYTASYRCVNNHVSGFCDFSRIVFQKTFEEYLLNNIDAILSEKRISAQISPKKSMGDKLATIKELSAKIERIGARFEDGDITIEEYRKKRDKLKEKIAQLSQEQFEPTELPVLPENWKEIYSELDDEHKAVFWKRIIKKITVPVLLKDECAIEFLCT